MDKDFGEFVELHELTELKDLVELQISPFKENNLGNIAVDTATNIQQNQGDAEVTPLFGTRVTDVSNEPSQILNPILGLLDKPLCTFDETLQSLETHVPGINSFIFTCNMFASNIDDSKKQNLTDDEISSINLYTRESNPRENSFYFVLNKALRGQDRTALIPFFPYLHLLLHSMAKIPKCPPGTVLWRGVPSNISANYKKGKKIIWWGMSSCTKDMSALDAYLGQETDRTLFSIQVNSAIEIAQFSAYPREEEVLVFPCVTFEVQNVYSPNKGIWIVQLKEIFSPGKIITGYENLGNVV